MEDGTEIGEYSKVAEEQLDELERGDPALYNAVLDACETVLLAPEIAQRHSTAIATKADGIVLSLPVPGYQHRVWWAAGPPPRVLAVFPT